MATATLSVVKSDPDTSVNSIICNTQYYSGDDPFGNSVAYVLADLMNVAPSQQPYDYYTVSPYPTSPAYGHATCSQALANSACANCLASARGTVSSACAGSVGGQVGMVDCSMRYENYPFA
ncbi:hypothetical protein Sango_0387100 [Sesamum angolense]|uniref:Gnk2-homologous domain-containing protein n=1 Tax=Sesamum angolense TaxID=2727404 RepID=A0AAE1XAM1_9LAMI|nr:hypothetical protein Sango_0387100 [Sesamum angolense]